MHFVCIPNPLMNCDLIPGDHISVQNMNQKLLNVNLALVEVNTMSLSLFIQYFCQNRMKMISGKNKNFFFFIQEYILIGNWFNGIYQWGYCIHVSLISAYGCFQEEVSSQSLCEDHCTSQITCVGYQYNIKGNNSCTLFPSDRSCPSGFLENDEYDPTAASINDLRVVYKSNTDYVCYGKI